MSHIPIIGKLASAFAETLDAADCGLRVSRRTFLRSSFAIAGLAAAGAFDQIFAKQYLSHIHPRIAIIGAGAAGLTAAYYLRASGIRPRIFEGSTRTGGRIFTSPAPGAANGQTVEMGGEFIDTAHTDLLHLARKLGILKMMDRKEHERGLTPFTFFAAGKVRTDSEVREAFRAVAPRIAKDIKSLPAEITYKTVNHSAIHFDKISLAEYLSSLDAEHWLLSFLNSAYKSEYGAETSEQSSLNFLTMIDPARAATRFEPYGTSDERYKIMGGNSKLIGALAKEVGEIEFGYKLVQITEKGKGYKLTFENSSGAIHDDLFDILIISIPFTMLRDVEIKIELPPKKLAAIRELGYGTPAKVISNYRTPVWRELGSCGYAVTDEPFQCGWDATEGQNGNTNSYTTFFGGEAGRSADVSAEELAAKYFIGVDKVFPCGERITSESIKFQWSNYAWMKGGYASYKPGQWTAFGGAEGESFGNLYFVGEHCSTKCQGFMNGAVETGKRVAARILS